MRSFQAPAHQSDAEAKTRERQSTLKLPLLYLFSATKAHLRKVMVSEGFGGSSRELRTYGRGSLADKSSAFLPVSSSLSRLGNGEAPCCPAALRSANVEPHPAVTHERPRLPTYSSDECKASIPSHCCS